MEVRLCFALRCKDPACYTDKHNYHKADDDAPSNMEDVVSLLELKEESLRTVGRLRTRSP